MRSVDIYRSAKLLIDQHGDEATIHAAMRADELLDAGDLDGAAVWRKFRDHGCETDRMTHSRHNDPLSAEVHRVD